MASDLKPDLEKQENISQLLFTCTKFPINFKISLSFQLFLFHFFSTLLLNTNWQERGTEVSSHTTSLEERFLYYAIKTQNKQ